MNQAFFQNLEEITQALNQLNTEVLSALHIYDPCDVQTLFGLIRDELQKAPETVDATMLLEFLVFHRTQIKPSLVGHIHKILSYAYAEAIQSACKTGRISLAEMPADDASAVINMLMENAANTGENTVSGKCSDLIGLMPSEYSADLSAAFGDYAIIHNGDIASAMNLYRNSLNARQNNLPVCQRMLSLLEYQNAWKEAIEMLDTMIALADDSDKIARYLCKKGWILLEKFRDSAHAIESLSRVLEIKPTYYDIFLKINAILLSQNDLSGIETHFNTHIERQKSNPTINSDLLSVLYRDLGGFRLQQRNDAAGAIEAYKALSDLHFENIPFHLLLARLYEMDENTLREAVNEYRKCLALALETQPALCGLARCYRRLGLFDEALCTYRVINALHFNDEEGDGIVSKFADMSIPEIKENLSNELWNHLIPETLDKTLVKILSICNEIIGDMFSNEFSSYGIQERSARIDISENTTFNNTIRNETKALGFGEVPLLYRCDRYSGVTNAYFSQRSFLIHPNCLKGRSLKELAFMTAKAMMLIRPEYYLLSLGLKNVELILIAIIKTIDPGSMLDCALDRNQQQVSEKLDRMLTQEQRSTLKNLLDDLNSHKGLNVLLFMESVEDFANRIALLFCDDPTIIEKLLGEEARPISSRTMHSRMKTLMRWALSEDYFTLRRKLNIALEA